MESETEIYRGGWIYSRTLKYLFKASLFYSYLQHYLNRLYIIVIIYILLHIIICILLL